MKRTFLFIFFFSLFSFNSKGKTVYTQWGDYNQFTVPLFSFGLSWYHKDYKSMRLLAKSYISTQGITHFSKKLFNTTRPNGGNHSFPSGHTSSAFSGVNFLYKRYGKAFAIPAFIIASSVGHSRMKGKYHHFADVLAGALLSLGIDEFFFKDIEITPLFAKNYKGLNFRFHLSL